MDSEKILYYPYINIPDNIWTSRSLLYWDNVGVIVPEDYIYNPEKLEPYMHELVSAQLVEQIIPRKFTEELEQFKNGFFDIILTPKFRLDQKRINFRRGNHLRIHVEKFDNGIMQTLEGLGLARWADWPWWHVETETAKILMVYLASIISVMDNRRPVTDNVVEKPPQLVRGLIKNDNKLELRNRLLNDILPLPTKIEVRDLEKIKSKYSKELNRFRNNIEKIILDINQINETEDFEKRYKLQINEITETKKYIIDKLSEPKFGKIVFGTLCSLSATGIAIAQTPDNLIYWTIPSIMNAVYQAVMNHKRDDILKREPLSYLALIDRQLK
ncbi:hypothetical protein HXX01_00205 [Candidatus Nomurabacteria bacterium]|nr:hypothetical protein [Candidatus Nomurabacteria bacterium]